MAWPTRRCRDLRVLRVSYDAGWSRDTTPRRLSTERTLRRSSDTNQLRDAVANVFREHFVDRRLVPDVSPARFLTEQREHAWIQSDRDQSARFVPDRRPSHSTQRLQLVARRLRSIRVVNLSRRTPRVRAGLPAR